MTLHALWIPRWRPATCNELMCRKVRTRIRLKKIDRGMVATYAGQAGIPRATTRRKVALEVVLGPRQRETDADSLWKSTLDALAHAGLILGDRVRDVELGGLTFRRPAPGEAWGTRITLEDLESA